MTWQFTQKRASEVNWEKIDPRNFSDIALDYKFGPQVSEWTAGEPSFGPPSTPSASCDMRFVRANSIFIRATTYCGAKGTASSERWTPSDRNAGRDQIRMVGAIRSERLDGFPRNPHRLGPEVLLVDIAVRPDNERHDST